MIIIGELINTSRKPIKAAVEGRDADYIQEVARKEVEAGVTYVDVNAGTMVYNEPEVLAWLVETVQSAVDVPLCIDSPNPKALKAAQSYRIPIKPSWKSTSPDSAPNCDFSSGDNL